MKSAFRSSVRTLIALAFVALCAAQVVAQRQNRDLRVVTARAGGVNYVFGEVKFRNPGRDKWKNLDTTLNLDNGDVVRTGATGLVEVLLNPGSYLRLGTNSEVEMFDTSLDELRIKLTKGSAVIEATGYDDTNPFIKIDTPHTQVAIVKSGVYRINVLAEGATEVAVQKGRALVGKSELSALVVKGGKVARVVGGSATEVAKLDKKNRDELDLWSKDRGEELAEANRRISQRQAYTLMASLNASRDLDLFNSRFSSGGIWYYDSRRGCYTFMPFGFGWRSPYGYGYDSTLNWWPGCYSCGTSSYGQSGLRSGGYYSGGGSSQGSGGSQGGGSSQGGGRMTSPAPVYTPSPRPEPAAREMSQPAPSTQGPMKEMGTREIPE